LDKKRIQTFSDAIEPPTEDMDTELPNSPLEITDDNFDSFIQNYGYLIIDFCTPNYLPCGKVSLVIDKLAEEYQGKVVFGKLDINETKRINHMFNIAVLPTLLFIKDGTLIDKVAGDIPEQVIEHKIRSHLGIY
jgi:thioredoxin 1